MSDMKLSQPRSARTINTCRVLCALRGTEDLSKAELSRLLELNKVSTGEIVNDLISDGLVRETEKAEVSNGRRPTMLTIVPDSRFALAVDIGRFAISVALCDLNGNTVKVERIPTPHKCSVEEFCVSILKSCVRTIKLVESDKILGAGITVDGVISEDGKTVVSSPDLEWKDIPLAQAFEQALGCSVVISDRSSALVNAEKQQDRQISSEKSLMYVDWSNTVSLALVSYGHVFSTSREFGAMQLSEEVTLDSVCSTSALGAGENVHMRDLWSSVPQSVLNAMSKALRVAYRVTGASRVTIGGEAATIVEPSLDFIREKCPMLRINRSCLGDRAYVRAAAELALDNFFYRFSMLEDMKDLV